MEYYWHRFAYGNFRLKNNAAWQSRRLSDTQSGRFPVGNDVIKYIRARTGDDLSTSSYALLATVFSHNLMITWQLVRVVNYFRHETQHNIRSDNSPAGVATRLRCIDCISVIWTARWPKKIFWNSYEDEASRRRDWFWNEATHSLIALT